jgi:hypothetical protein
MSSPKVTTTELDGALGVLPASAGKLYALAGAATAGPINTPASFGRPKDVIATFGSGAMVEAACHELEVHGRPVLVCRTAASVAGLPGTLDDDLFAGSSAVTVDAATPNDDFEAVWKAITGGTIGTAGITFQWSLDNGRTWSPITNLGTATTFEFPGTDGLAVDFAAGTVIAGDQASFRTTAPQWNAADLAAGIDALRMSAVAWEVLHPVGAIDGNAFDTLETKFAAMESVGQYRMWEGNTRMPEAGESEAAYLTAMNTIFASKAARFGALDYGAVKLTSSVSGRKYRRPVSFKTAALHAVVSEEINIADVNLGPLLGVSIRDANGNPDEHDELLYPGADDARFTVLRTFEGRQGVYVNRPRLFSAAGSDFQLVPHRRVMNLGRAALDQYFQLRLSRPVLVDASSGFILEEEALEIESGALAVLRATIMAKPKASGVLFVLSRIDNLLSSKTMTGDARIIPLAYPEFINIGVSFFNPALQIVAV